MKGLSLLVWKLWPRLKFIVHAIDAEADADGRAMTLAPRTYLSRLAKKCTHAEDYSNVNNT